MHDALVNFLLTILATGIGWILGSWVYARLPRIRFEARNPVKAPNPPFDPKTEQGGPGAAQIQAIQAAVGKALAMRAEALARKVEINDPNKLGVPLRETVLTREMQERGPVPDVPAIKWTNDAINAWLCRQGYQTQYPVHIFENPNGNLLFSQPREPEKVYGRIDPIR